MWNKIQDEVNKSKNYEQKSLTLECVDHKNIGNWNQCRLSRQLKV